MSTNAIKAEIPKVMLVDDDEGNLLALSIALRDIQCEVIRCNAGATALDYLAENKVAVIFLDVRMPGMDGFEVARRARELRGMASTPIIFVTGSEPTTAHIDRMFDAGGTDFLSKPVHLKSFRTKAAFFVDLYSKTKELKNKTALLKESAELERANLLENALDAVVGANEKNVIIFWNKNAEEIFGWSKEEALGKDLSLIIPERFQAAHIAGMQRFVRSGIAKIQNQRLEVLALRRNGTEFAAELTVSSLATQTGYNFYSFMRDISEQKKSQQALQFQAERLSLITNAIPDLIAYVGNDGRYQFANDSYEKWFGKKAADIIGCKMEEVLGEAYVRSEPNIRQVLSGIPAHFQARIKTPAGIELRADTRYIPDIGPNLDVRGFVIVAHDVTEIETSREIVQHQSQYLELVLNRVQAAIILVDPRTGDIKLSNQKAQSMMGGLTNNTAAASENHQLLNAKGQPVPHELYPRFRAARGEKIQGEEFTWITPHGSRDYLMYSDLLPSMLGQPTTAMVSFLDVTQLKNTERSLRQKEAELQTLADAIPQLAWMANPDGSIFWFNQRWYEFTGTNFDQMHGWSWKNAHDPSMLPKVLETYHQSLVAGERTSMEYPLKSATGELRWFLSEWLPLKDDQGKVLRWFGTNTDIHEQKLAREDQEFRANLTLSLNTAEDLETMIETATSAVAKHLQVSKCFVVKIEENQATVLAGSSSNAGLSQKTYDLRKFSEEVYQAWKSGDIVTVDDVRKSPWTSKEADIHLRDKIHSFITVPQMQSGVLIGAMNVSDEKPRHWEAREVELIRMVSETLWSAFQRFELLAALRRSTRRSSFIAKASKVLNSTLDSDQILGALADLAVPEIADWCSIRMVNTEGELKQVALSHRDPAKVKWGRELETRFPPNPNINQGPFHVLRTAKPELITPTMEQLVAMSTISPEQIELIRSIGISSYICVPILCRDRAVGTLSLVLTDEIERKYTEEDLDLGIELGVRAGIAVENARLYREAQAVNRLKDEFLANLSHELRTPMNVIQGYAEILKSDYEFLSEEEFKDYIDAIQRNGKALTSIIADLLDVSSIITGKISYKPTTLNPAEVIPQILESLRPTAAAKGIHLTCDASSAPKVASADLTRLHQIVWNLVSNAIKFTDAGGRVDVKVTHAEKHWSIEVSDTGKGIDAEFIPYVFDRFRQEDASSTRRFGGLGLGLSVVRHLIELHGGYVRAESPGRGQGARFIATLPLQAESTSPSVADRKSLLASQSEERRMSDKVLKGTAVLLVEDSQDGRSLLVKILTQAGANVVAASSAEEARQSLNGFSPDVIVSDIGMPDEDGITFIQKIRAEKSAHQEIPAIALTAFVREEEKALALSAGFQMHLGKPVTTPILIEAIQKLVRPYERNETSDQN